MNNSTVLITGGCGFIGSNLAVLLKESFSNAVFKDLFSVSSIEEFKEIDEGSESRPVNLLS